MDGIQVVTSPESNWAALIDSDEGSLALGDLEGDRVEVFPRDSTVQRAEWSPDGRYLIFWFGPNGASIRADGLQPYVLDVDSGRVDQLDHWTLLNPAYHSWAPNSSALAITAGSYRSAQVNKWLNIYNTTSGETTTVISQTEQVPGIVSWSPRGDRIAYAAVSAEQTSQEQADWMAWENSAIAARRIYLLDPESGRQRRLNSLEAYQDAPCWSEDGSILYYVQRLAGALRARVAVMAAEPETGQTEVVASTLRPLPDRAGYYGQTDWRELLAPYCPLPG